MKSSGLEASDSKGKGRAVDTDSGGRFRSAIPLQSGHEWPPLMKETKKMLQFCESSPGPLLFRSGDSDLLVLQVSAHYGSICYDDKV